MDDGYLKSELRTKRNKFYERTVKYLTEPLRKRLLNFRVSPEKVNLPDESCVLTMHHELGIDGWILSSWLYGKHGKKVHFLTQREGLYTFRPTRKLLEELEEIPLSVDESEEKKEETAKDTIIAVREAGLWLKNSLDYVGVFGDGPFKDVISAGRKATPLAERKNHLIPALIAKRYKKLLIPISEWCDEKSREALAFWWMPGGPRQIWRNFIYMAGNKPLPYFVAFGEPLDCKGVSIETLSEKVRQEQLRLYEQIRGD